LSNIISEIAVLFMSKEKLEEKFFKDLDGDFWLLESMYEDYAANEHEISNTFENYMMDNSDIGKVVIVTENRYNRIKWAVERVLTPEADPEYFI